MRPLLRTLALPVILLVVLPASCTSGPSDVGEGMPASPTDRGAPETGGTSEVDAALSAVAAELASDCTVADFNSYGEPLRRECGRYLLTYEFDPTGVSVLTEEHWVVADPAFQASGAYDGEASTAQQVIDARTAQAAQTEESELQWSLDQEVVSPDGRVLVTQGDYVTIDALRAAAVPGFDGRVAHFTTLYGVVPSTGLSAGDGGTVTVTHEGGWKLRYGAASIDELGVTDVRWVLPGEVLEHDGTLEGRTVSWSGSEVAGQVFARADGFDAAVVEYASTRP